MHWFYMPENLENEFLLPPEESKHLKVLRIKNSDEVVVVDGRGSYRRCRVINTTPPLAKVEPIETILDYNKPSYRLHVAIAPTKSNDRFEWFVEKATELGISEISPMICARSERSRIRTERLKKIAISAMKQSRRAYLPLINEPATMKDIVENHALKREQIPGESASIIAYCSEGKRHLLSSVCKRGNPVFALVGPEGDFSDEEYEIAREYGIVPVTLGPGILRTETAGIAICTMAGMINQ
jgi:16S rRNA (uracil1498-N3)-methyltransferase